MTRRRRRLAVMAGTVGALLLLAVLAVAYGGQAAENPRAEAAARGPLTGVRLYVDPASDAAEQERRWLAEGRGEDAEAIRAISRRPGATWFGEPDGDAEPVEARVERVTTQAAAVGQVPLLVLYSIPHRDCGLYSSGGSRSASAYRRYVDRVAAGIGDRPALVVLEPDAVGHLADGCVTGARSRERARLLSAAVETLAAKPRVRVYLDGGNAGWIAPDRMASLLRAAGIARADGFAVNVANFQTTEASVAHGRAISRAVGGKPFVVDTSRNGRGPWRSRDPQTWCNPPGRALGTPPRTHPAPSVDAYLWIKHPGASDGTCRNGPPAGQWWPEYALGLARAAG